MISLVDCKQCTLVQFKHSMNDVNFRRELLTHSLTLSTMYKRIMSYGFLYLYVLFVYRNGMWTQEN